MADRNATLWVDETHDQTFGSLAPSSSDDTVLMPSEEWAQNTFGVGAQEYSECVMDMYAAWGRRAPPDAACEFGRPESNEPPGRIGPPWLRDYLKSTHVSLEPSRDRNGVFLPQLSAPPIHDSNCSACWRGRVAKAYTGNRATRRHALLTGIIDLVEHALVDPDSSLEWTMESRWDRLPQPGEADGLAHRIWAVTRPWPDLAIGFKCTSLLPPYSAPVETGARPQCNPAAHLNLGTLDDCLCPTDSTSTHVALPFLVIQVSDASAPDFDDKRDQNANTAAHSLYNTWQFFKHCDDQVAFVRTVRVYSVVCSPTGIRFWVHRARPRTDRYGNIRLRYGLDELVSFDGGNFKQGWADNLLRSIIIDYGHACLLPRLQHAVTETTMRLNA